jgi:hypothetical protein
MTGMMPEDGLVDVEPGLHVLPMTQFRPYRDYSDVDVSLPCDSCTCPVWPSYSQGRAALRAMAEMSITISIAVTVTVVTVLLVSGKLTPA